MKGRELTERYIWFCLHICGFVEVLNESYINILLGSQLNNDCYPFLVQLNNVVKKQGELCWGFFLLQ